MKLTKYAGLVISVFGLLLQLLSFLFGDGILLPTMENPPTSPETVIEESVPTEEIFLPTYITADEIEKQKQGKEKDPILWLWEQLAGE